MRPVLWQTLAGTSGGHSRLRILYLLSERPQNANRLAKELSLNYTTVRYHLERLEQNGLIEKTGQYAAVYLLTDQINEHWGTVEKINEAVNWE